MGCSPHTRFGSEKPTCASPVHSDQAACHEKVEAVMRYAGLSLAVLSRLISLALLSQPTASMNVSGNASKVNDGGVAAQRREKRDQAEVTV
jgi:hypothetical protein